jgi:hypothetical protein
MSKLATAYAVKKRSKKHQDASSPQVHVHIHNSGNAGAEMMAEGGDVRHDRGVNAQSRRAHEGVSEAGRNVRNLDVEKAKGTARATLADLRDTAKPKLQGLAHGGKVMGAMHLADGGDVETGAGKKYMNERGVNMPNVSSEHGGESTMRGSSNFINKHNAHKLIKEIKSMPSGNLKGLADGGEVDEATTVKPDKGWGKIIMTGQAKGGDIVDRAMKRCGYSQGGKVANEDSGSSASDPSKMAKSDPNEFDDLALDDDLEASDTGANSGDELGSKLNQEDDFIARVMKKRAKR